MFDRNSLSTCEIHMVRIIMVLKTSGNIIKNVGIYKRTSPHRRHRNYPEKGMGIKDGYQKDCFIRR